MATLFVERKLIKKTKIGYQFVQVFVTCFELISLVELECDLVFGQASALRKKYFSEEVKDFPSQK